jgi:hypothetical protein
MKFAKPIAVTLFSLLVASAAGVAQASSPGDLLQWSDCPPGVQYYFGGDPMPAHFQASPLAGPSGGSCSLDVVSGSQFVLAASSAGGVAFGTPGEVAGGTYTVAFDFQFVSGTNAWIFANESGSGDLNGLSFSIPYPGDNCFHHYEFTGSIGAVGPKPVMFIYQGAAGPQEMRIDNMTITPAPYWARPGLVTRGTSTCTRCAG